MGTVSRADGTRTRFGFVPVHDTQPRRRLFEQLQAHGMQANQQVTFLTDGADDVRDLTMLMNENAEHVLDWFHVTMRLTVLRQIAKGLVGAVDEPDLARDVIAQLERVKWFLWHGNVYRARQALDDVSFDLDTLETTGTRAKLAKLVDEFDRYLALNATSIPNYGERHRAGEAISSAMAESTVNEVISRRMVKKQQMRWTPAGAHQVLQIRCRVLDNQLAADFQRWHPNLTLANARAVA